PVPVAPGAGVIGATVNKGPGRLLVRAEKTGEATALAQIMKLVEDAQASKANVQRLADKVSAIFVPAVILVALMTLLIWVFGLGATFAAGLIPAVAVLVIACPCALGL